MQGLELRLPPSVNALHINRRGTYQRILTREGRDYIYTYSLYIKKTLQDMGHKTFNDYVHIDIEWYLPRKNCDSHNYEKGLWDCLQQAGFVTNDKYIMGRTQSVSVDTKNPRVVIKWYENKS